MLSAEALYSIFPTEIPREQIFNISDRLTVRALARMWEGTRRNSDRGLVINDVTDLDFIITFDPQGRLIAKLIDFGERSWVSFEGMISNYLQIEEDAVYLSNNFYIGLIEGLGENRAISLLRGVFSEENLARILQIYHALKKKPCMRFLFSSSSHLKYVDAILVDNFSRF